MIRADTFRDIIGLKSKRPDLHAHLVEIVRHIEGGYALPEQYYRKNRNTTFDALLDAHGVMHLHLEHPGCSELLYLAQFDDRVVLLEISNHVHVDTKPIGTVLAGLHKLPVQKYQSVELTKMTDAIRGLTIRKRP